MRATIRNLLTASLPLTAIVPAERWYTPGAVIDKPGEPFAILRWLAPVSSDARGAALNQLRVDVHDKRGSYLRIEEILGDPHRGGGVYAVLSNVAGHTGVDGYVAQADYLGHSGDQEDPDYRSNFKFSSWQIIGRNL